MDWFSRESPSISLEPANTAVNIQESFSITIKAHSKQPVNAFDVTLSYPTDTLLLATTSIENSIIDLWVKKPQIQHASGTVRLIGGVTATGGWRGDGELVVLTFEALRVGAPTLQISAVSVLAHDGAGSNTNATVKTADVIIQTLTAQQAPPTQKNVTYLVRRETAPPTDINNDGKVTVRDLSIFMSDLKKPYEPRSDFDQDGIVSIKDLSIIFSAVIKE